MSRRDGSFPWLLVSLWAAGNSLAGAVIGLTVGFFKQGGVELPLVLISVLCGNVVGFTAMIASVLLFPRLHGLPQPVRQLLLALALVSGSVLGTIAVLNLFPLFVFRDPSQALAVVVINGVLALIVGGVVYTYEGMRLRLQESLRQVEEVRLVESRLREEAARSELAALQARINPHFFFNTLNTIASLLDEDTEAAETVLQTLADLFRYTLEVADAGPVPLGEELDFTRAYLTIEQARFGERLRVRWEVEPAAREARVPGLILQPLVENAVAHGIAPRAGGGTVTIRCRLDGGMLRLDVADDGVGLDRPAAGPERKGRGLDNVRQRLDVYYRGRASLELGPASGGGACARLLLPPDPEPMRGRLAS